MTVLEAHGAIVSVPDVDLDLDVVGSVVMVPVVVRVWGNAVAVIEGDAECVIESSVAVR